MPRVQVPSAATKGEIFQVKALISHQMETGLRKDSEGNVIPRFDHQQVCLCPAATGHVFSPHDLRRGHCRQPVFVSEFFLHETQSGRLEFV